MLRMADGNALKGEEGGCVGRSVCLGGMDDRGNGVELPPVPIEEGLVGFACEAEMDVVDAFG